MKQSKRKVNDKRDTYYGKGIKKKRQILTEWREVGGTWFTKHHILYDRPHIIQEWTAGT